MHCGRGHVPNVAINNDMSLSVTTLFFWKIHVPIVAHIESMASIAAHPRIWIGGLDLNVTRSSHVYVIRYFSVFLY